MKAEISQLLLKTPNGKDLHGQINGRGSGSNFQYLPTKHISGLFLFYCRKKKDLTDIYPRGRFLGEL